MRSEDIWRQLGVDYITENLGDTKHVGAASNQVVPQPYLHQSSLHEGDGRSWKG